MLARALTGATMVVLGVSASQMPEFAQQYRQRLGGAVDELRITADKFDLDARVEGLSRDQALKRHLSSADELFKRRGSSMIETFERFERLEGQLRDLKGELPIYRMVGLAVKADSEIGRRTMNDFEPAIPISSESGILGGIGAILGWFLARLFGWPGRFLNRKLAARALARAV